VRQTLDDAGVPAYASGLGYSPFGLPQSGAQPAPFGFTGGARSPGGRPPLPAPREPASSVAWWEHLGLCYHAERTLAQERRSQMAKTDNPLKQLVTAFIGEFAA
jgi:hypothetical protein